MPGGASPQLSAVICDRPWRELGRGAYKIASGLPSTFDKVSLNIPMTKNYLEDAIKIVNEHVKLAGKKLGEEIVVSISAL